MKAGWKNRPLGELCLIQIGGTPPRSSAKYWDQEKSTNNVWLSIADMPKSLHASIVSSEEHLSDAGAARVKIVKAGTLLVSFKLTLGRLAYAGTDLRTNEAIAALTLLDESRLQKKYLYWYLTYFDWVKAAEGEDKVKGKTLNKAKLAVLPVLFPPLAEQHRIVALLDKAFAGIATARANAEKSLRNAAQVFSGLSERLFPQDGHGPSEHSLADLCEAIVDCEHKTAPTQDEGIPSIRTPNIGRGELLLEEVKRVSEATYKEWTRRAEPKPGDLILAREAPAGNVAVIPDGMRVCLGQRTVLLRPRRDLFEPAYLAHLLLQPNSQNRLLAHSRGATVQHVNVKDIREFKVASLPTLSEQRKVIAEIKKLAEQEAGLLTIYTRKLAALDELKQSLLHQAFSGQL